VLFTYNYLGMNGIIITNQEIGHNVYKIKRYKEEFSKLDISLDVFVNDGTLAMIKDNELSINLPKCDFIIYLDKDIYLARILEKAGYRLFNKADFIKLCDDKALTNIACASRGIKMPDTITGPLFYSQELKKENLRFLDDVIAKLGLPLILKRVYGSLGLGVYLIKSKEELIEAYKEHCRAPILFQKYVGSSYGVSARVIIINKKVVGGFIRYNKTDFRSNFGENASSRPLKEGDKCFELAVYIAKELDIEYAGIDFMFLESGEPILCEINSNAFFEEFEKVTGINVAKEYALMIKRKIYE